MCIHGGYKTQTVTQIANVLSAYDAGEITLRALRVYFASLVSVAAREAAKRARTSDRRRGDVTPRFLLSELSRLTGLSLSVVKKELRALRKVGLLSFGESEILFASAPREESLELSAVLSGSRSPSRPIPLPRSLLRYLARSSKASVIKTALLYAVRGLTLSRSGEVKGKGSVKATWIAAAMKLSERSVRSARAELIALGWLQDDEGSSQRKLNRTGAYFELDLSWSPAAGGRVINGEGSEGTSHTPEAERGPVDNSRGVVRDFAPLAPEKRPTFAPPYENKKTPNGSKNQKAQHERLNPSGVCAANRSKGREEQPNIRDVRPNDLLHFGRVEELYRQAVKLGLAEPSEAGALNFLSAAVRAQSVKGDAPRVFMGIIRRRLWAHITQADEDRAIAVLRRYRAENPGRFRIGNETALAA